MKLPTLLQGNAQVQVFLCNKTFTRNAQIVVRDSLKTKAAHPGERLHSSTFQAKRAILGDLNASFVTCNRHS